MKSTTLALGLKLGILLGFASLAAIAPADRILGKDGINVSSNGSGRIEHPDGRRLSILEARVYLIENGRFTMEFRVTNGQLVRAEGRWSSDRFDVARVRVERFGASSSASGDGIVSFERNGAIDTIRLNGRVGRQEFHVDFAGNGRYNWMTGIDGSSGSWGGSGGSGGWGGSGGSWAGALNVAHDGSGRLRIEGRSSENLRRARVILNPDGRAEIRLAANRDLVMRGRWVRRGQTAIVTLQEGLGLGNIMGTATVHLRGRNWDRIEANGRDGRRQFSFNFRRR